MAQYYEIHIDAGADYVMTVSQEDTAGTAIPLTGFTARMMLKSTYTDTTPLISLTSEVGGGLTINEAAGEIEVLIEDTDTATLCTDEVTEGVYDLEIESPAGVVTRLIGGPWFAYPEATKEGA